MSNLEVWIKEQKLQGPSLKSAPAFYKNLEEALDVKRRDHLFYTIRSAITADNAGTIDFCSNDSLSLGSSGILREEFMQELQRHPEMPLGPGSTRVMDGNYSYLEKLESDIARFHGAETGLFVGSGFEANLSIFAAIPRPGDVILYDEYVHASAHDGMAQIPAITCISFRHNDVDSFRDVLLSIYDSNPLIRQGKRCVIVPLESFYSMDGDICPLRELVEAAKELLPAGTVQFYVDEAHSNGIIGRQGRGLVCELGLEHEISIRLHTFSKAMGATGAIILGNKTLVSALLNLARNIIYTTAPSFLTAASVRAGYNLLQSGRTKALQSRIQNLVTHFLTLSSSHPAWVAASTSNPPLLTVPHHDADSESTIRAGNSFYTHIIPLRTQRPRHNYWLAFHLFASGIAAFPIEYPVVPKGQGRVRLTFHAGNTEAEVQRLVEVVGEWLEEMRGLEKVGGGGMPRVARRVYKMLEEEGEGELAGVVNGGVKGTANGAV